jgi:hypothetical protein
MYGWSGVGGYRYVKFVMTPSSLKIDLERVNRAWAASVNETITVPVRTAPYEQQVH